VRYRTLVRDGHAGKSSFGFGIRKFLEACGPHIIIALQVEYFTFEESELAELGCRRNHNRESHLRK